MERHNDYISLFNHLNRGNPVPEKFFYVERPEDLQGAPTVLTSEGGLRLGNGYGYLVQYGTAPNIFYRVVSVSAAGGSQYPTQLQTGYIPGQQTEATPFNYLALAQEKRRIRAIKYRTTDSGATDDFRVIHKQSTGAYQEQILNPEGSQGLFDGKANRWVTLPIENFPVGEPSGLAGNLEVSPDENGNTYLDVLVYFD